MEEISIARLSPADMLLLRHKLNELNLASSLEGLFWLPVPLAVLSEEQRQHLEDCGPYIMALDTDTKSGELRLEPLVRAEKRMHCTCIAPAGPAAVAQVTAYLEKLLGDLAVTCRNCSKDCQA